VSQIDPETRLSREEDMPDSKFYFEAILTNTKGTLSGIPVYAFHPGLGRESGWSSGGARGMADLQGLAETVNVQVPLFIALPRAKAVQFFAKGSSFSTVELRAFRQEPGPTGSNVDQYRNGPRIRLIFNDVRVLDTTPILQWKGLPAMPDVMRNTMQVDMGNAMYVPVAVELGVVGGVPEVSG
jgi:hypothetical protein